MKKLIALLLAVVMVFGLVACSGTAKKDDKFEIVVVPKDSSNPWFVRMKTGVDEYAAAHTELNVYQKGTDQIDATLQAQLVEDLIAQGVDAICVVPVDIQSIDPVLKKARDKGIIVIAHEGSALTTTSKPSPTPVTASSLWTTWRKPWAAKACTPPWLLT